MGRWRITIDGVGAHHNNRPDIDADLATRDFVKHLKAQGHNLEAARFEQLGAMVGDEEKRQYVPDAVEKNAGMNIDFLAAPASGVGTGEGKPITDGQFAQAAGSGT